MTVRITRIPQPTIRTLIAIAQALGVRAVDLVRETELAMQRKHKRKLIAKKAVLSTDL